MLSNAARIFSPTSFKIGFGSSSDSDGRRPVVCFQGHAAIFSPNRWRKIGFVDCWRPSVRLPSGRRVSRDHQLLTGKRSREMRKFLNFATTDQIANAFSNASRASR